MDISKVLKDISGINAYQNRKEAKSLKSNAEQKYQEACNQLEDRREKLNDCIQKFGTQRCEALKSTIGVFLSYLKEIEQKYKSKEYEIDLGCDITHEYVQELTGIEMNASTALKTATASATAAAVALGGVPALVTSSVTALATASTGTAISTLSGAAQMNAVLAWLGGGSLASGGGGVALGTAVLSGITYGVTGGVALVTAGLIASKYFEKKLTEAKKYEAEVDKACAQMDLAVSLMDKIEQRANELLDVTSRLAQRCKDALNMFEPFVSDFEPKHPIHIKVFQRAALFIKAMSELAKTPLLDNEGNLTESSVNIIMKTDKIMNENL